MKTSKKKADSESKSDNHFIIPIEKKKKIFGIILGMFSLICFFSIISHSQFDEANLTYEFSDLLRIFSSNPEFIQRAESTRNWLGILGAYISGFFLKSTLGYFSLVFAFMLGLWSYSIVFVKDLKKTALISNYMIISGLLLASFFGMIQTQFDVLPEVYQVSGKIGLFLGSAIGRLLGGLGSIIFYFVVTFIFLFIVFDFKIESIVDFFKNLANAGEENKPAKKEVVKEDNISKIKELRNKKDKSINEDEINSVFENLKDEAEIYPAEKSTTISIIRTDDDDDDEDNIQTESSYEKLRKENQRFEVLNDKKARIKVTPDESIVHSEENLDREIDHNLSGPEQWEEDINFISPGFDLLNSINESEEISIDDKELKKNAELLKEKLLLFDIKIENISVTPGPVVTLYELVPAPGVKISRIVSLENDIALALAAKGIRIIAPIPGKSAIGVEIPNLHAQLVSAKSVLTKVKESKAELPLALGKTISGDIYITDLAKMPHVLIAGSTGSGKSVGINMLITSLLYSKHPSDIKFVIVDPKKIELSFYQKLNKHYLAVSPDIDEEIITLPSNALLVLKSVEIEMERRYDKLAKASVRNIVDYNIKIADPKKRPPDTPKMKHFKMPYLVVIIDELADLMMTSGKEVEAPIARLAQLARAVGIHLVVATQRPSVNVITGVIKANFPARVAYQTATKIDSRTILDMKGAEQLLGRGDMLFLPGGMPKPVRIQNAFITTEEVEKITNFINLQKGYSTRYFLPSLIEKKSAGDGSSLADLDPMFEEAARIIVRHQQGSVSLLQRRLKLGYSRAARIVDQLEQAGIVGPAEGSKAREVRIETEEELETIIRSL